MLVRTRCPKCRTASVVKVDSKGYEAWCGGALIQEALPQLSNDDREKLMTGYDQKCWDELYTMGGDE